MKNVNVQSESGFTDAEVKKLGKYITPCPEGCYQGTGEHWICPYFRGQRAKNMMAEAVEREESK